MPSSPFERLPGAIIVTAELEQIRTLAAWLREACETAGVGENEAFDLELAMVEAANNIVLHGYRGCTGSIGLDFHVKDKIASVVLADEGAAIPPDAFSQCRAVPAEATHGRGINIMQSCVDSIDYTRRGAVNVLTFSKWV